MCGIAGFMGYFGLHSDALSDVALRMGDAIRHRGPDDFGVWRDDSAQVVFVHRRLSILDLSPAGHQPMVSASGRYVLTFNGEIYNHLEMRKEVEASGGRNGMAWRGHSDTETLLACIDAWGLEETLRRSVGMFALALWDKEIQMLSLARDRMGEKPLYYGWQRNVFLFGSELKALQAHPAFVAEVDRDAITLQLRHNYIPAPYSIYKGIHKLLPGHLLQVPVANRANGGEFAGNCSEPKAFWSLANEVKRNQAGMFASSDADAVKALEKLLRDAVSKQMVADVPLGAFLSGGVDSSTVVALMQSQSSRPVKTFTIGFNESGYNEAEYAAAVARHLGTDHTELYVTPQQALGVISRLPALYDEPFSDESQIPTFLLSEMTRQHVTVSLSGDGGDELFGGYSRYSSASDLWRIFGGLPGFLRKTTAASIQMLPVGAWDALASPIKPFIPKRKRNVGDKLHKLAEFLTPAGRMDFYRQFISHWPAPESVVLGGLEPEIFSETMLGKNRGMEYVEAMMLADSLSYLPDDILVKIDRAAMAVSLETRVPFLDHRVVEFAWQLPLSMKVRNGQGKWMLREVLYKYVPKELIDRPKMGFGVPLGSWLRGPLREWAESLLDESRLRQEGFLNPMPIRQKWAEHLAGARNWQNQLWDVLMFQAWLEGQKK